MQTIINSFKGLKSRFQTINKLEWFFTILVLAIITYAHAHNMFLFPYYENDEGTYMSQAWAITNLNKLAPYTYWYDHAPLGWMFLAFFSQVLGGYNAFGNAINTGRVIMLLIHIASTIMIIATTRKITNNWYSGLIAAIIFGLFPLGNGFQRRVLLDNIMVFMFSISLYFSVDSQLKNRNIVISSFMLGMAILSKESAIFFIPGMLYLIYYGLSIKRRVIGLIIWIGTLASVVALYPILAILKTELFPSQDKVSLMGTIGYQASRGRGLPFWAANGDFMISFRSWVISDIFAIIAFGILLLGSTLVMFRKNKDSRFVGIFMVLILYIAFLIRGKTVLEFYVIPLFFLFGLLGGLVINYINVTINKRYYFNFISLIIVLVMLSSLQFGYNSKALYRDEVTPYKELISWINKNIPGDAHISIDCGVYMDLQFPTNGNKVYKNADWYWKNDYDPEIRVDKLKDNPLNIDYIFETFQYLSDIDSDATPFNKLAYYESKKIVDFSKSGITSNLLQVIKDKQIISSKTWSKYVKDYIKGGANINKKNQEVSSQSQSYAMLRSIMNNDLTTFNSAWFWTKNNLQKRDTDKLFISQASINESNEVVITNPQTSTESDLDIALSLIIAGKKWSYNNYIEDALIIIKDIYANRVVTLGSNLAITPFISQKEKGIELISPNSFSPAHFRVFAMVDPDKTHRWNDLAFESYKVLDSILENRKLIPNWIIYNYKTNKWEQANSIMGPTSDDFGYEASRLFWRINLDKKLFGSKGYENIVKKQLPFFEQEYIKRGMVFSSYNQNGEAIESYETTANDAGIYSLFNLADSNQQFPFWRSKFIERIDLNTQSFDITNNQYNQNYGSIIFGTKEDQLKNIIK